MSYINSPYTLSTTRQIATPDISLSSSSTGSSYIDQLSISDPYSIDRQLQVRQRRSGTAPTTLLNYTNGDSIDSIDSIDSTTSPDPLPRGNSSVKTISPTSSQRDKLNVAIDADTKLNEYLMIYEDDSIQNLDARRFINVMKDSSLITRRLNVSV